ncbi:MAG TPA: TIGR04372 family glycosyltransferase, partial [Gammaproteobacteria bacterium]|nr:TIGR04372 family glycosyltransferase [Gammaproteobacteria bacterium]
FITSQGGWVIKMGSKKSQKLPRIPKVIDYARSKFKSELMDIYIIKKSHYFIGTTSGLTNIATSFEKPCVLVNCITIDSQFWPEKVRFALKKISISPGKILSQRQLTSTPWRWRVFDAEILKQYDATIINNSSDEILETVKEVHSIVNNDESYIKNFDDSETLLKQWQNSLEIKEFYGAALPSIYYLSKHQNDFIDQQSR